MSDEKETTWTDAQLEAKFAGPKAFNTKHANTKNEEVQEIIEMTDLQMRRATRKAETRKDMWIAMRKSYDGLPEGFEHPMPAGRTQTKYLEIQEGLKAVEQIVTDYTTAGFAAAPEASLFEFRRKGSGDEQMRFAVTVEEAIKKNVHSAIQRAKGWFDAKIWDGTPEGLNNLAPHTQEDDSDA